MATIKKQYYGIKFPFTSNNLNGFFIDLNSTYRNKTESEIAHVLLTSKKSRIRMPDFGTDLIRYIFEPNDELSWDLIVNEAKTSVNKYVKNVSLSDVQIIRSDEDPYSVYLSLEYTTSKGNLVENNKMTIKL